MIRKAILTFLRIFTAFRDLEEDLFALRKANAGLTLQYGEVSELCEGLRAQLVELECAIREEMRAHETTKASLEVAITALENERARRISSDTVAGERREEIQRLVEQNKEQREQLTVVMTERLKSLDTLNLRLMDTRTVEKTPDLEAHKAVRSDILQSIRAKEQAMDMALVNWGRKPRVTMNESPAQPEPVEQETAA